MKSNQQADKVAQPADEELKKHGDQLARQVRDAAATDERSARPAPGAETQVVDD